MNETKLPSGWKLVPVTATPKMAAAIENEIDAQLTASGMAVRDMHRQDGFAIYAAAMEAAPQPGWSSATAPGPDGMQHCIAVPGMPSAARDAALVEAAKACIESRHGPSFPFDVRQDEYDRACEECSEKILELRDAPAPVQQAAPSLVGARVEKIDTVLWDRVTEQFVHVVKHHPNFKEQVSAAFAHKNDSRFYDAADITAMWKELTLLRCAAPAQPVGLSEQDKLDAAGGLLEQAIDACDACMDISQVEPEDAAAWQIVRAAILAAKEAP